MKMRKYKLELILVLVEQSFVQWIKLQLGIIFLGGANSFIGDNDFHEIDPAKRMNKQLFDPESSPVHIGSNVWLSMNATVLKGVSIGDN